MDVTVQICSRNRKDLLKRAITALFEQDFPKDRFELVIMDDGSEDGTSEMLEELSKTALCKMICLKQPHSGLAKGRNESIKAATGKYILFIDDDIIADKHLISEHYNSHEKHPKSIIMGWVNHTANLDRRVPKFTMADISTSYFWTSNVSLERKYLFEVGLFDEDFKEYGWEDLELGRRLKKHGLIRRYNNRAVVFHYKGHWKKGDLPRLIKQTQAKARTAVIFLEKDRALKVKLATASYAPRLWLNRMMNWRDGGIQFCEKVLSKLDDSEQLTGFNLVCAQNLVSFHYFKELEKAIRERKGQK